MSQAPKTKSSHPQIVIAGAGSIGCFIGGLLAAAGHDVTLLGRARVLSGITQNGLTLTDFTGLSQTVSSADLKLSEDPEILAKADYVLVTVKSGASAEMADLIAQYAPATAPVLSLQNGIENADTLRAHLPGRDVRAGMVPFNVVPMEQGRFHRATSGDIMIGTGPGDVAGVLSSAHLLISEVEDISAIQWGKVMLNLNNALNALSGLTLQEMLTNRDWRRLMADQMAEALTVLRAAGIAVKSTTPVPAGVVPHILRLPTPLFRKIAAQMLTIDPTARASMAYDLMQNRPTEIDALQGTIIRLGATHNIATPINTGIAALIRQAERDGKGLPSLSAQTVRSAV